MDTVTRSVKDIAAADRRAIEHVIGQHLSESQRIVIQVLNANTVPSAQTPAEKTGNSSVQLPDWCNVYEGLSDSQIADIEAAIHRSHDSRSFR
jgi:hypothetical protein